MKNIKDDFRIEQWFEMASVKDSTREVYCRYMQSFCDCVKKTPSELIDEANNEVRAGKLVNERSITGYLTKFKVCIREKKLAPKTQALAMATVKSFFMTNDVQLPSKIGQMKKVLPLKENMTFLTHEDVKNLIVNAKSLRMRAFILMMATSGMAKNEILNLRGRDIVFDEETKISTIKARREKAQVDYTTFISPEATEALKNYLDERNRTRGLKVNSPEDLIFVNYGGNDITNKGSPLGGRSFMRHFRDLGKELNYDHSKKGQFIKTRSHAMRKFFTKTLEDAGMPREKIDYLVGHTATGNNLSYFKADPKELKKLYAEFLPHLTFEHKIEVNLLDQKGMQELAKLSEENQELRTGYEEMKKQMAFIQAALQAK